MSVAVRGTASKAINGTGTSVSVNQADYSGGSPLAGSLLVAFVLVNDTSLGSDGSTGVTTPSGWTSGAKDSGVGGGTYSFAVFYRTAAGTSADNVTFSDASAVTAEWYDTALAFEVTGWAGTTVGTWQTASSTSPSVPSIGSAGDLELTFTGAVYTAAGLTITLPGGESTGPANSHLKNYAATGYESLVTPGTRTFTLSASSPWGAIAFDVQGSGTSATVLPAIQVATGTSDQVAESVTPNISVSTGVTDQVAVTVLPQIQVTTGTSLPPVATPAIQVTTSTNLGVLPNISVSTAVFVAGGTVLPQIQVGTPATAPFTSVIVWTVTTAPANWQLVAPQTSNWATATTTSNWTLVPPQTARWAVTTAPSNWTTQPNT